jgi:hypothetical protein
MSLNANEQENIENKIQFKENFTYPLDNNILYRERINKVTKHSYKYIIIKEEVYPNRIRSKGEKNMLETNNENNNSKKRLYKISHALVEIISFGTKTFRQRFGQFGHVIRKDFN